MRDAKSTKESGRNSLGQYCMLALHFTMCMWLAGFAFFFLIRKLFVISFGHIINGKENLISESGIIH